MGTPKDKNKFRKRTLYYFRCSFSKIDDVKVKLDLESMVNKAWENLNSTEKRSFYIGDERSVVGMKLSSKVAKLRSSNRDCTLFSVGLYEEGASANTINKPSQTSSELEADTYDAPLNQEFLDGEGFVCVLGNHIMMSPAANLRAGAINSFIVSLLNQGGYSDEANVLDIQQVADIDMLKTIEDEGVSNIEVNAVTYLSSLKYIKRISKENKTSVKLKKITDMVIGVVDLFREDDTNEEILEKEGLNTRIQISHDGRSSGGDSDVGQVHAKDTAKLLASSNVGGYVILTKKGTKLTNEDIVLKHTVQVKPHGKSVSREQIWSKLVESIEKYDRNGVLEQ